MKTLIFILACIMFPLVSISTNAQEKKNPAESRCVMTIDQLPQIRGLRLGQPYEELLKVLPRTVTIDPGQDEYGVRKVPFPIYFLETPALLANVYSLNLMYFDGSLSGIHIAYTSGTLWQTNLHFVAAIAEQLKLPRSGWLGKDTSHLNCRGFAVEVSKATFRPTILVVDTTALDAIAARKREVEKRKRAKFRP
jgi:hypothetical protein